MKRFLPLVILLLPVAVFAADPVKLPDVQASPGELTVVDVSGVQADAVAWETLGPAPRNVLPLYKPGEKTPYAIAFATNVQGTWWVVGAAVKGGQPFVVRCQVTVGAPPPPPGPTPNPPNPTDPFAKAVADAYATDPDPQKAAHAAWAAAVMKGAVNLVDAPDVKTYADLLTKLTNALHDPVYGMPRGSIAKTLAVVTADFNAVFGTVATASIDKAKVAAEFTKAANALGGLR